ncbi:hypothetical protein EKO27_g2269 [Xylaria grammica]|uniref:Protein kinase domain-containing protein n=1 Tax=Xylaria grammica TaxID=363999 RepID=A0A439DEH2_9PEZI|nr:hypothetical protein EKO27_g2269 [Xylaria grammica]
MYGKPDGSVVDADGPEVSGRPIAENYGPAMNAWGIAVTMWQAMTQMKAPFPPQPQTRTGSHGDLLYNYCARLLTEDIFGVFDLELRVTIARCMAYDPRRRLSLRVLLQGAQAGINKNFAGETDQFIRSWIQAHIYNP